MELMAPQSQRGQEPVTAQTATGHRLEHADRTGHTVSPLQGLHGLNGCFAYRSQQAVTQNPRLPRTKRMVDSQQSPNLMGEGLPRGPG